MVKNNKITNKRIVFSLLIAIFFNSAFALTSQPMQLPQNFSQSDELLLLKKLEQYIRSSSYLIDEAQAMQRNDARYKFEYLLLKQDLSDIADGIKKFIRQDKRSQAPRKIRPLIKEY